MLCYYGHFETHLSAMLRETKDTVVEVRGTVDFDHRDMPLDLLEDGDIESILEVTEFYIVVITASGNMTYLQVSPDPARMNP